MPSKRRNVKQPPAATAQPPPPPPPPPTAASLPASAAAAVTQAAQAAHAAQAAAATADTAVKTATAAAAPTASAVSDAAAAVQSAIAAYQTVAAALAALHDSLAVSTVPTPLAAPPQPSGAVVAPPPLRELLPGQSWWDWMPSTVRRRLLALAGIDPDASRWGTIPYEIQLMILKAAGPLTLFVNGLLGDKSSLDNTTVETVWIDAITQDWHGDLDLLPDVNLCAGEVIQYESPVLNMLSLPVSRSMYGRLCIRFPDQASADDEDNDDNDDAYFDEYELDYDSEFSPFESTRLCHIPMRSCWLDLLDFRYPIALGWQAINFGHAGLLKQLVAHYGVDLDKFDTCGDFMVMDLAAEHGHLDILQMLHEAGNDWISVDAMGFAAGGGHLDVVKWLHTNRTEGCSKNAMDLAAGGGHLDVVKWLHENRTEGCTAWAMDDAARKGRLDVVQWLHAKRTEGCTANAIDSAAEYGCFEVMRFLVACGYRFTFDALRVAKSAVMVDALVDSMSLSRTFEMLQMARHTVGCNHLVVRLERAVAEKQSLQ